MKKSEAERQQQGSAEFSSVPSATDRPRASRWIWMLAALLGINIAVLLGIFLRSNGTPESPAPIKQSTDAVEINTMPAATEPSFVEQVAMAQEKRPAAEEFTAVISVPPTTPARVRTIDELRLDGSLQLAELHIDIHVYSDAPDERFVFINMVKHRERSRLAEGPVVAEITLDGVILEHNGLTFLLPRE